MGQRLGQHFLTRPEIAGWVADAVPLSSAGVVLEIGPGHGILTRALFEKAKKVVAVEKDPALVVELEETFAEEVREGRFALLQEDVRDFDPAQCEHLRDGYVLAANIPYYITGQILRQFLTTEHQPSDIALLIQKEVAERAVARGDKQSLLALSIQAYGTPEFVRVVKAGAFSPPPKVDSAILAVRNISHARFADKEQEQRFFELLHTAFEQKRKMIGSTLRDTISDEVFARCDIDKTTRPENVSLEEWLCLAHQ